MATPLPLLVRLLNTPNLATVVPQLPAAVLHRVIEVCGLEDAAEIVALATPAQISRVLDVDVWHSRRPGAGAVFDADRFGLWLGVLVECGAAVAAEKLVGLDLELVVAGFTRHVTVADAAAAAAYETLDGEVVPGRVPEGPYVVDIKGYALAARRLAAWDAIVELLTFLASEHPEYFQRLMRECVRLSSGPREADGFHDLLQDRDQQMFDLAGDREERRGREGFVAPAEARAFLQAARQVPLDAAEPPKSPMARAYFRAIEPPEPSPAGADAPGAGQLPGPVIEILRDAGVFAPEPRALLEGAVDGQPSPLAFIQAYAASHPESAEELAYLANALVAGCGLQGRPFTAAEASDAAVAVCNLGLENWPPRWQDRDLVSAFQVGWSTLNLDVCMYAARRLITVTLALDCPDRDIRLGLQALRRELKRHLEDGMPWRARNALEVIMMLDAPSWAALGGMIDECPVMHAAVHPSRHAIAAADFEFISQNSQIAAIHEFVESLAVRLG